MLLRVGAVQEKTGCQTWIVDSPIINWQLRPGSFFDGQSLSPDKRRVAERRAERGGDDRRAGGATPPPALLLRPETTAAANGEERRRRRGGGGESPWFREKERTFGLLSSIFQIGRAHV